MTLKRILLLISFILFSTSLFASDIPIIFIHGHKSEARPEGENEHPNWADKGGWVTWYPRKRDGSFDYHTAMTRIIQSHYGGYSAGSPLNCIIDSTPRPTGGETRKIYNFSYYHPNGDSGVISLSEESVLVYISHGWTTESDYVITVFNQPPPWGYDYTAYWPRYVPGLVYGSIVAPNGNSYWCLYCSMIAYDWINSYVSSWKEGKFAKRLAEFIDKVLMATGAQKVDIVAHSMGGVVARAAIKNYGCANKVRKLLMIGTPNHTFANWLEQWYIFWPGDKEWQKKGEDAELGVSVFAGFTDLSTGIQNYWHDFLGYDNYIEGMSTIAGNKGRFYYGNKPNDGLVAVEQVGLSSAQFNPVIYASHSYDGEPEVALTTCTYTEEFIKNWIIDDDVSFSICKICARNFSANCTLAEDSPLFSSL